MTNLLDLPDEILLQITAYLDIYEWHQLCLTCQRLENIVLNYGRTLKTDIITTKKTFQVPTETFKRHWNKDSGKLCLDSMRVTGAVLQKVAEECNLKPKHVVLTDCYVIDSTVPETLKPDTLELIRCSPTWRVYDCLWTWATQAFRIEAGSERTASFFIDGGLSIKYLNHIFCCILGSTVFSCSLILQLNFPCKLVFEDKEYNKMEEFTVTGAARKTRWFVLNEKGKSYYSNLVWKAIKSRREGKVAMGITFSRFVNEDIFQVAVTTSTSGPELMEEVERDMERVRAQERKRHERANINSH